MLAQNETRKLSWNKRILIDDFILLTRNSLVLKRGTSFEGGNPSTYNESWYSLLQKHLQHQDIFSHFPSAAHGTQSWILFLWSVLPQFFFFFLLYTHFLRVTEAPFKLNLNVWLNWGTGYYSKQVYHYWLARQGVLSGAQRFQPWFVNSDINQEYSLSKKCERSHRAELLVSVRSTQWMTFLASLKLKVREVNFHCSHFQSKNLALITHTAEIKSTKLSFVAFVIIMVFFFILKRNASGLVCSMYCIIKATFICRKSVLSVFHTTLIYCPRCSHL